MAAGRVDAMQPRGQAGSSRLGVDRTGGFTGCGTARVDGLACRAAATAVTQNFDCLGHEFESHPIRFDADEADGAGGIEFQDGAAGPADEEHPGMRSAMGPAADKGVDGVETMDETGLEEEIERAIDGRRSGPEAAIPQGIDQIIGLDRLMILPDEFQHLTPDGGQAQPLLPAGTFGFGQRLSHAMTMIVSGAGRGAENACGGHGISSRKV